MVESRRLKITMKKQFSIVKFVTLAIAFSAVTFLASAHERDTYRIGDKYYVITVGSLNEPFVVDSMSGVDLRVSRVTGPGGHGVSAATNEGTPVTGLEQTLKVELAAGNKKETLSLVACGSRPGILHCGLHSHGTNHVQLPRIRDNREQLRRSHIHVRNRRSFGDRRR